MSRGEILDIEYLNQLVSSLEEAGLKLEEAYNEQNYENFNKLKKLILQIRNKISEVIE